VDLDNFLLISSYPIVVEIRQKKTNRKVVPSIYAYLTRTL
jgi:hypothetical protein